VFSHSDHAGDAYAECLCTLHDLLRPASYLEIRTKLDETLAAASCPTVAVAAAAPVQPLPMGQKPALFVFNSESRAFFDRHDPRMLLGRSIDLVFLDGLPLFEEMLWDFCNVERLCKPGSLILLNNCIPLDIAMAGRDPDDLDRRAASSHSDWWTGDAWKLLPILAAYRPDLTLHAFDAAPAGLVAITGLDPGSRVLADRYDVIVSEYRELDGEEAALWASRQALNIRRTADIADVLRELRLIFLDRPANGRDEGSPVWRFVDPFHLPPIDLPSLSSGMAEGRYAEPPDGIRSYFRAAPVFIDDPQKQGIIHPFGNDLIRYRASSVLRVNDALLVGYRSLLTASGYLVHDELQPDSWDSGLLADKLSRVDDEFLNEETGLRPADQPHRFTLDRRGREIIEINEPVVVLSANEPDNYGSWIYRVLPKLRTISRAGLDDLRLLVHVPEPYHREYLEALGVSSERVLHHDVTKIYRLRRAFVPSLRNNYPFLDPAGRQLFTNLRLRYGVQSATRRIYVSRVKWSENRRSNRVMTNEKELVGRLSDEGFDIVEPETLSFIDQVKIFSTAQLVVGPAGSALYNVVFCAAGTKIIDIESEPHWVPLHSCLFASLELPYGIFVGATDPTDRRSAHKRWSVDIDALVRRVRSFASASPERTSAT
jgi:hypothetical protein